MYTGCEILIVDDDVEIVTNLKDVLEDEGYCSAVACDGQTALALCREQAFDLALIDIKLPDIPGLRLVEKLAELSPGTEYIIITGYASLESAVKAIRQKSIVAYETKPFDTGRFLSLIRQILERKQAEMALRESKERFRNIYEKSPIGIELYDSNGRLLEVNQACLEIFGICDASEVKGFKLFDDPNLPDEVKERLRKGETARFEIPLDFEKVKKHKLYKTTKSGIVYLSAVITPLGNKENESLSGYLIQVQDITRRKKLEEELLKAQKLESVGILAGGIAHDFNNILTAIIGNISLAKLQTNSGDEIFERLTDAEKATQRAKDLTQQLLTFARGGAPIKKRTSISELIKDSTVFALRGSKVRCEFSIPDDLWQVEVDEGQISRVINNLIINADQSMPEGGIIYVCAENMTLGAQHVLPLPEGKYVKISIEDHGIGIPEEHFQKIFDPYFTTKEKGSGLGLATSYSIIKRHDGFITVESEMGVGTTFFIYLPAYQKETLPKKKEEEKQIAGRGKILLMDDEEIVRKVTGGMLKKLGYEVDFARDGAEAIELYKLSKESGAPFDVVIMDLTVPGGMGGVKAIEKLLEIDPEVKAIVSSGYFNDPVMADFRKYGFSGVAAKPYRIQELSEILYNVRMEKNVF